MPDTGEQTVTRSAPRTLQDRIHAFTSGLEGRAGGIFLKRATFLVCFVLLALWFDTQRNRGFGNQEAMESAQLARRLAEGNGYTTLSIRPLTLGLLQRSNPSHAQEVLQRPVPDLSIAPGYPFVLAGLMKILPFHFTTDGNHPWVYPPEALIVAFNEALFLLAVAALFGVARKLFDSGVAWVSAITMAGSEVYWRFCLSGLSTMLLLLVFLLLARCLMALEERERREPAAPAGGSVGLAAAAGALVGIGGLTRYSFAWMMVPVLVFLVVFFSRTRAKLCLLTAAAFLAVFAPWVGRNLALSGTPFGTAGYAILESARPMEYDSMERSFNPLAGGHRLQRLSNIKNKFMINEAKTLRNELPRLGGNWAWSFFLCSLLLPFRNPPLRRMRIFLIGALALFVLAQAFGQTNLSAESPEINSENLLVLAAPLVLVFGVGFFFTLLEQMALPTPRIRTAAAGFFAFIMCAPLLLDLAAPLEYGGVTPYVPHQVRRTASWTKPDELMMSDIPWAVAWYGNRACAWLPLDDTGAFDELNKLKPVEALYLTERTTDRSFLQQMLDKKQGWGRFLIDALPPSLLLQGSAPKGFPLTNAYPGFVPVQLFLTDKIRWETAPKK